MTKNDKIVAVVRCSKFREFLKVLLWHYVKGHKWKDGSSFEEFQNAKTIV